ncbi:MAG: PaaI family thioesterase [Betaproteobacteria bacterium]
MTTCDTAYFKSFGAAHLPGLVGVEIVTVEPRLVHSRLAVRRAVMAPNGFLHAATVVALADTSCGYGCVANLPRGASGFTTLELKANFLGTAREGFIACRAVPVHLGRTTQVWDAEVTLEGAERKIALFRCTQMVLWQNPGP